MTILKTAGLALLLFLLCLLVGYGLVTIFLYLQATRADYGIIIQRPGLTCCEVEVEAVREVGR